MVLMSELLKLDYGEVTGIFRISSGTAELKQLHTEIMRFYQLPNSPHFRKELQLTNPSAHCVAGMLKRYFREVEPPIIPYSLYGNIIEKGKELFIKLHEKLSEDDSSAALSDSGNQPQFDKILQTEMLTDLFDLIWSLPVPNRTIFSWLMLCLFGVSLCEEKTKMGPENIALVFGPNLMRFKANPSPMESMKMLEDSSVITLITGVLIRHARDLFSFIETKENEENQKNLLKFTPFVDNFGEIPVQAEESAEGSETIDDLPHSEDDSSKSVGDSPEEPLEAVSPASSQNLTTFIGALAQKYQQSGSEENSMENLYSDIQEVLVGDKEEVSAGVGGVVLTVGYLVQLLMKKRDEEGKGGVGEVVMDDLMKLALEGEGEAAMRKVGNDKEEKEENEEEKQKGRPRSEREIVEEVSGEICDLLQEIDITDFDIPDDTEVPDEADIPPETEENTEETEVPNETETP
eukprot:CAMPEP_0201541660 /NCGR_PEP_ID=MMETSP0161_2-20130828/71593_1 /ASSEMBLY_ACC=CAM_ASM_000251 /TAXON_ID=180227 /ORGANISM="Neoparamoeba aestuarina, Strain SoJaBio B1-5/56/2" /LENGTH=461 /DNA_ID=CAMNT_0047949209 /DNA_START=544 /DNA_END=1929 /DNA_ORIENTATION=+